ncbi:hypothetical protein PGT21_035793 [Puccinia graminis f. sp. tritici]|uniref:Uncharacterized protein n=1 Tax=Puccinia graminis f. sp. tritici TaxID=56615 RepID=A0A5B0R4K6_PUCGR|nr:hypothetical protein PGT21_035793 [Puccinia graminis f. sp. tritici]
MARLSELMCAVGHGDLKRDKGPVISDVQIAKDAKSATIALCFAKTAIGGDISASRSGNGPGENVSRT